MQTPKLKRKYIIAMGVKIGIYQALKLVKADLLTLKYWVGLSKENTANIYPNSVKWLYLQCNFLTFSGGACPLTLLEKLPPPAVALSVTKKKSYWEKLNKANILGGGDWS